MSEEHSVDLIGLENARRELHMAAFKAGEALPSESISLPDRIFALKIILFCQKMLYSKWKVHWRDEIESFYRIKIVARTIRKGTGEDFEAIKTFTVLSYKLMDSECRHILFEMMEFLPDFDRLISFTNTKRLLKEMQIQESKFYGDTVVHKETKATLLHYVIKYRNVEVLQELLQQDCELLYKFKNKQQHCN